MWGASLSRERVCRLQLLIVLANAVILGSESLGTHDHILLSQIRDLPNLEGQVAIFISSRNRMPQLYPQALCSILSPPTTRRAKGEMLEPASALGLTTTRLVVSLYNLVMYRIENTVPNNLLYCCSCIHCRGNVFTQPLPRSGPRSHVTYKMHIENCIPSIFHTHWFQSPTNISWKG
jgi:hypothetical protein